MARTSTATAVTAESSRRTAGPKLVSTLLLLAATGILLTLLFPPFYCFFLAPIALIPFCVCILRRPVTRWYLLAYYGLGFLFFAANLFWLAPVTIGGLIALALFVGLYLVPFAWGLHRLVIGFRMPATLAVPIAWTTVEYCRSTFVHGGFPWFILGNSLAPAPILLQTADLFGVWGVTFLIALVNGLGVDLLRLPIRREGRFNPTIGWLVAGTTVAVTLAVGYGAFRLGQETITAGPRVAVVQENIPQEVKDSPNSANDIFLRYFNLTREAAAANPRPDLIAWPETMVPGFTNSEFLNAPDSAFKTFENPDDYWIPVRERGKEYLKYLQELSDRFDVKLLLGIGSLEPRTDINDSVKQNRTVLMMPRKGVVESYAKVHLVPFGEYIPFKELPVVGKYMLYLSPYGFDYSNKPGEKWTRFTVADGSGRSYSFATPICFEDTMPYPARMMVSPATAAAGGAQPGKKTDFLVNVSNDGWFAHAELDQHLEACQLRAVENRVPIARSVNTGDSGFIDSNGRIVKLVMDGNGVSAGVVGTMSMQMPLDSRVSPYSWMGDLLPIVCGVAGTLIIGWTYARPRRGRA